MCTSTQKLSLCVHCCVCLVLKRAKVKKGKNDLIGAEEGEEHFTDISSVGKAWHYLSAINNNMDP